MLWEGWVRQGRQATTTHPPSYTHTHTPLSAEAESRRSGRFCVTRTDGRCCSCCAYHLPPTTHHALRIPGYGYAGTLLTTLFCCPTPFQAFWVAIQSFLSPKYRVLYTTLGHFISIPCMPHVPLPLCISHPVSPPLPSLFATPTSWVLFCHTAAPFLLAPLPALTPPSSIPPPQASPSPAQPRPSPRPTSTYLRTQGQGALPHYHTTAHYRTIGCMQDSKAVTTLRYRPADHRPTTDPNA